MADLNQFDTTRKLDGATLVLKNPSNNKPIIDEETKEPVSIVLISADSSEARALRHKQTGKVLNDALGRQRRLKVDSEELEGESIKLLATLTKGWKHVTVDGKKLECTTDSAIELYTRFPWIMEQVDAFINDRSNFLGN